MAAPGIPQNFTVQQANQQILIQWSLSTGADSYIVQRSQDNVTYTTIATVAGVPLATQYLDTAVTLGTQYWYKVAAATGAAVSPYTTSQEAIPTPTGEMTLSGIRLAAKQRADRVNSNFVTDPEWRNYINQAMFELYDILITEYEDYYVAPIPAQFTVNGAQFQYPLPDGTITFNNGLDISSPPFIAPPFYKLLGVDLALNNATNGYVTLNRYNFANRNQFVYPNTASTIYGVFNLQYRVMGNNLQFIPTPSSGQQIRLWYIPRLQELLLDTDITTTGISGWIEYVIVKAAYYALTKEESDTQSLVMQLVALTDRITSTAANRDAGTPDRITDSRGNSSNGYGNGNGSGFNGSTGGF